MEENSDQKQLMVIEDTQPTPGWTPHEMKELEHVEKEGARPIAPTLSAQMFALYLEGYSCSEIAKQNKPFSEGDILFCRKKFSWDDEKDRYAFDLQKQMRDKLVKTKFEAIEFLTNKLTVIHKAAREQTLRYMQTGKAEDLPKDWELTPSGYKAIFETIQKVTGEDRVSKQEIRSESTVTIEGTTPTSALHPELQARMLDKLAELAQAKRTGKGD